MKQMILEKFMDFTNWVNAYRRRNFDMREEFPRLVQSESLKAQKVLEVGCNLRPINQKSDKFILHGLDPDDRINMEETKPVFHDFFKLTLEEFKTENTYDLIVLNMVYEHLEDNNKTIDILKSLLNENGKILICAPSNLHPFSIINQILPHDLKLKVLSTLLPWKSDVGVSIGWKSYYDKCNIVSLRKLLESKSMKINRSWFSFNGSEYFSFFPPLFLLIVLYEEILEALHANLFCATFMVEITNKTSKNR